MRRFAVALAFAFCWLTPALAQIVAPEASEAYRVLEARYVVPEGREARVIWAADETTHYTEAGDPTRLHFTAPPGRHWIEATAVTFERGKVEETLDLAKFRHEFTIDGAAPTPVPPRPEPQPDPTPPVTDGKRVVLIVSESLDSTAAFAQLAIGLRSGTAAAYLTSKGHKLWILDDDAKDQNGQTPAILTQVAARNVPLPALFVIDAATGQVLHERTLAPNADAAAVLQVIREHGG